jgi:hypothetical protein
MAAGSAGFGTGVAYRPTMHSYFQIGSIIVRGGGAAPVHNMVMQSK